MSCFKFLTALCLLPSMLYSVAATVSNNGLSGAGSLFQAITDVNSGTDAANTITFSSALTITLTDAAPLPAILLDNASDTLTITGAASTLNGNNVQRGFIVSTGTATISNLTMQNCRTTGGAGGVGGTGGGGGGGLGGAVFVNNTATVTLSDITFSSNSAIGGAGGSANGFAGGGGGGGGGMGGSSGTNTVNDGTGGGGGGGLLTTADGSGSISDTGGAAGSPGGAGGTSGAPDSGGVGPAGLGGGGGGGGGASPLFTPPGVGASADLQYGGGGGGGGSSVSFGPATSAGAAGGAGAFGAGGGGGGSGIDIAAGGAAGIGGGAGGAGGISNEGADPGGGGGGAGLGANVFVRTSGTLTIDSTIPAGTVTAGAAGSADGAGTAGSAGQAGGSGLFVQSGTVTLNTAGSRTVSGVIADGASLTGGSGAGAVTKTGAGTVTLSATNAYSGATTVSAGTLTVNGSVSASSATTVSIGATLKGSGSVSALTVFGTLAPGNSIGTINVEGTYLQAYGSTLDVELSPTNADRVNVTGLTTIEDKVTLNLIPEVGDYSEAPTYIIIDSPAGITGTFSSINMANSNLDGIPAFVEYTTTRALLHLGGSSPLVFLTSNMATRLNRMQTGLITEIQNQRFLQRQVCYIDPTCCEDEEEEDDSDGQVEPSYEEYSGSCSGEEPAFYHPFIIFDYSKSKIDKRPNMFAGKDYLRGGIAGCDFYFTDIFTGGLAVGYIHANSSLKSSSGNLYANNYNASAYFQLHQSKERQKTNPQNFYLDGSATFAKAYYESKTSLNGYTNAKYHGYEFSLQGRLLYQNQLKNVFYRPYMSTTYFLQEVSPYTERRDTAAKLKVDENKYDFLELEFGLNLWAPFNVGCWRLVPQFSFAYVKGYLRDPNDVTVVFAQDINALPSTLKIANISTKQWKVAGGLSAFCSECTEIFFTFESLLDEAYSNYQEYRLGAQRGF